MRHEVRRVVGGGAALLLLVGPVVAQLYVHPVKGCDDPGNPGTSPGMPLQTLTNALGIAAGMPPPVVIHVGGALLPGTSTRVPYDDVANTSQAAGGCSIPPTLQGLETFPLSMLGGVDLVWEPSISDAYPGTTLKARPLIRFTMSPLSATLIEFGPTHAAATSPVDLLSLDLEYGFRGVRFDLGTTTGTVAPILKDVKFFDCYRGVHGLVAPGQSIMPTVDGCEFAFRPHTPSLTYPLTFAYYPFARHLFLYANGIGAATGGTVKDSTFTVDPTKWVESGVRFAAGFGGTVDVTVESNYFDGGDSTTPANSGMRRAIEIASNPVMTNASSLVEGHVIGNTVQYCEREAIFFERGGAAGTFSYIQSYAEIGGNRLTGNNRAVIATSGQVHVLLGPGRALRARITSNTIAEGQADGVFVGVSSPGVVAPVSGSLVLTIDRNQIEGQRDGIRLTASDGLLFGGPVSRNKLSRCTRDSIVNEVVQNSALETSSTPDIVDNIVAYPQGDGIVNRVTLAAGGTGPFVAAPRMAFNTVAFSVTATGTGAGLRNVAYNTGLPAFTVHNSIFRFSPAGTDIVEGPVGSPAGYTVMTVNWCNFATPLPGPMTANNSVLPGFVNPPALDFHLAAGSLMIDSATVSPISLPATDIDGNRRIIDTGPPGPAGLTADRGADERP